jgi:hypothetical protein
MKSRFLGRAVALATALCFAAPVACGSSDSNPSPSGGGQASGGTAAGAGTPATSSGGTGGTGGTGISGGSGGTGGVVLPPGTSSMPMTIQCGGDCTSARAGFVYVDPCCSAENNAVCGVDTSYLTMTGAMFKQSCEPKNQPGELNPACPSSQPSMTDVMGTMVSLDAFPGCCRPTGTCGVTVDTVTAANGLLPVADLGLGCVDAASFFPGMPQVPCTEAAGGAAGATSAGSGGAP